VNDIETTKVCVQNLHMHSFLMVLGRKAIAGSTITQLVGQ